MYNLSSKVGVLQNTIRGKGRRKTHFRFFFQGIEFIMAFSVLRSYLKNNELSVVWIQNEARVC